MENVPRKGGAIIAANHLSFMDSLFLPLKVPRRVTFLAKAEYWDKPWTRWFFKGVGQIPVRRRGGRASEAALEAGVEILRQGGLLGVYPEGTRSPDGRLYRGHTGPARMAWKAGVVVVPAGIRGTREVLPPGSYLPRLGRVEVVFGLPMDPREYVDAYGHPLFRRFTDELMARIRELSGQEYVDVYAQAVKEGKRPEKPSELLRPPARP